MTPAAPPPPDLQQPLTTECVAAVSQRYQVHPAILGAVLAQEGGRLGEKSANRDGSHDMGPMQINSFWLPLMRRHGVEEGHLLNHGCYNLAVGSWILRHEQARAGEIWRAVGRYHSHDPARADAYMRKVAAKARDIAEGREALAGIVARANGGRP